MDEALISTALLTEGWRLTRSDAAANSGCSDVDWSNARGDAVVPGTVASTLIGAYNPDRHPEEARNLFHGVAAGRQPAFCGGVSKKRIEIGQTPEKFVGRRTLKQTRIL